MTGAVTVSFDNLGEVADLGRGLWPPDEPLGRHPSVTRALPRVRALLGEAGVRATFFVEGRNAELYPQTLAGLAAEGHEVALHGWCHEAWADLEPERERMLLARGRAAMEQLEIAVHGFRPPGGRLTAASLGLLREEGFTHCSPAGDGAGTRDGVAVLPFRWDLVDAFHVLPRFAAVRGTDGPRSPAAVAGGLRDALDAAARDGRHLTVVFHPFLLEAPDRLAVLDGFLGGVADAGLPCRTFAEVAARGVVADDLRLDLTPA